MARQTTLSRATSAASRKIEKRIRAELESGRLAVADVLRSERELATEYGVSRRTVRRALRQLVKGGWLVAKPRGGYQVAASPAAANGTGPVAFVHGSPGMPWEWSDFNMALWNGFQTVGSELARNMLVISIADRKPAELVESLKVQGASGAIIDSDYLEITDAMLDAGMSVVQVDARHPRTVSVMQDNFTGALAATRRLIEKGCRRIAFAGSEFPGNPNHLHLEERLGGYLSALNGAGLDIRPEWQVLGRPVEPAIERLVEIAGGKDGPDGAVILWPEHLEGLGKALSAGRLDIETVVWWGCVPERRDKWRAGFPGLPVPEGMEWKADDLARMAFARFEEQLRGARAALGRGLVPVSLVPGEVKERQS